MKKIAILLALAAAAADLRAAGADEIHLTQPSYTLTFTVSGLQTILKGMSKLTLEDGMAEYNDVIAQIQRSEMQAAAAHAAADRASHPPPPQPPKP